MSDVGKEVEFGEVSEEFDLEGYFNGAEEDDAVLLFKGDTALDAIDLEGEFSYIVIGDLKVNGNIVGMDDGGFLFVAGNCSAKNMLIGGPEIWIKGDLQVENGVLADYNHGCLTVEGDINARIVLAEHSVRVGGTVNGISVDFGGLDVKDKDFVPTQPRDVAVMNPTSLFEDGIVDGGVSGFKIYKALEEGRAVLKKDQRS